MKLPKRRPLTADDTERQRVMRASARHLADLRRAHIRPPADVEIPSRPVPVRIEPAPVSSCAGSPAALCAELGEWR